MPHFGWLQDTYMCMFLIIENVNFYIDHTEKEDL